MQGAAARRDRALRAGWMLTGAMVGGSVVATGALVPVLGHQRAAAVRPVTVPAARTGAASPADGAHRPPLSLPSAGALAPPRRAAAPSSGGSSRTVSGSVSTPARAPAPPPTAPTASAPATVPAAPSPAPTPTGGS